MTFRGRDRTTIRSLSGEILRTAQFLGTSSAQVIFEGPKEIRSIVITHLVQDVWTVASCMTMPNISRDLHDAPECHTDILTNLLSRATQPQFHCTNYPGAKTVGEFAQIWALPTHTTVEEGE